MTRIVRAFCIGHLRPAFEAPLPYTMLVPRALGIAGECVIADQRFGAGIDGAELAEYSQLFALQDLLEAGDLVADRLYLFQYRKFIGFRTGGSPATAPWLRIATPAEAPALMPTMAQLEAAPYAAVVGSMYGLGSSVAANYALVHVIDDLVAFAGCMGQAGFGAAEIRRFASFQGLLPSPALTLVEVPLFLRHMRRLRQVWTVYAREAAVAREGYQRRVAGYLLERLHSHLLCQGLMAGDGGDDAPSESGAASLSIGLGHRFAVLEPVPAAAASDALTEDVTH